MIPHRAVHAHHRPPADCRAVVPATASGIQHNWSLQKVQATQSNGPASQPQQSVTVYFREEDVLATASPGDDLIEVSVLRIQSIKKHMVRYQCSSATVSM